jgi:hypothetical protein
LINNLRSAGGSLGTGKAAGSSGVVTASNGVEAWALWFHALQSVIRIVRATRDEIFMVERG